MKPKLFIGSSVKALPIAYAIQENLDYDADVTVWDQNIFQLSSNALDDLILATETFNFGIFVFNPDDVTEVNNVSQRAVRDNVIFELGLFIGKLGKEKVFFLTPKNNTNLRLPTDLLGVTSGTYNDQRTDGNLRAALSPFCNQVRQKIKSYYYEGLIDFDNESKEARRIAVEKPEYWEYILTYELLDTRLKEIDKNLYDIERGLSFKRTVEYEDHDFLTFIGTANQDFGQFLGILLKLFKDEIPRSWGPSGSPGNVYEIKHTCDKIFALCKELITWQYALRSAKPPKELNGVVMLMKDWTTGIINDIHQFASILREFVSHRQKGKEFTWEPMNFSLPTNFNSVAELIENYFKTNYPNTEFENYN